MKKIVISLAAGLAFLAATHAIAANITEYLKVDANNATHMVMLSDGSKYLFPTNYSLIGYYQDDHVEIVHNGVLDDNNFYGATSIRHLP